MLDEHVSPAQLLQGRSPSLDLDSLYGAGPTVTCFEGKKNLLAPLG